MLHPPGKQTTAGSSAVRMNAAFRLLASCYLVGKKHDPEAEQNPLCPTFPASISA